MQKLTPYQEKAIDYSRHISLTANAGSGKTFVLARRYVEIACREDLNLRNIVAITFTDKAAGELNKKIAGEVDRRLSEETDPKVIRILNRMRRQLVSANISTIHSFCISILREFSPMAGLDAGFTPVDASLASELAEQSIEEVVSAYLNGEEPEKVRSAIRLLGSKTALSKVIGELVNKRKNLSGLTEDLYSLPEEKIAEVFRDKFNEYFESLFPGVPETIIREITRINEAVLADDSSNDFACQAQLILNESKKAETLIEKLALINRLRGMVTTTTGKIRSRGYLKKKILDTAGVDTGELERLLDEISCFNFPDNPEKAELYLASFGKNLAGLAREVIQKYEQKKKKHGFLDFDDLILHSLNLLKMDEVKESLAKSYKYIMIDEYQDTDESQYNIFMPILNNLQKGNLFVVGDEKQSIYRFRDAELRVFKQTRDNIEGSAGKESLLELPHSFRVAPAIALFTNVLFRSLFRDPNPIFNEVEHNDLVCARKEEEGGKIEFLLVEKDGEITEAGLTVGRIKDLAASGELEYRDIAVLVRKRSVLSDLETELIKNGIPYSILGGRGFYQSQAVYDVYNYLSFLVDQKNDTALFGILRSPFYTFSDPEIFNIAGSGSGSLFTRLERLSKENPVYAKTVELLEFHIEYAKRYTPADLIRQIWTDTGYYAIAGSKLNSKQELANMDKLISLASKFFQQGYRTLYDFVVYLKEAIDTIEDEGQAVVPGEDNSVKIMTIHQSKGLEFKAVFLYGCNSYTGNDKVRSRDVVIDKDFGILTKVPSDGFFSEYVSIPLNGVYDYISVKKNEAELKRLLYVAVTRAVDYLFITGEHKEMQARKGSFLELFFNGLTQYINGNGFEIEGSLKYMASAEENFSLTEKRMTLEIPVIAETGKVKAPPEVVNPLPEKPELMIKSIEDRPKGEIISATKVNVFLQCPLKYKLTYETGFSPILDILKGRRPEIEEEDDEKKSEMPADARGRLVHALLEKNVQPENLEAEALKILAREESGKNFHPGKTLDNIRKFMETPLFREISSYKNFNNEFSAYAKLEDFYLYGIIDKLIIEKNKLIIIDYKTDEITEKDIKKKVKQYRAQLLFYALLAQMVTGKRDTEIMLAFTSLPGAFHREKLDNREIDLFRTKVVEIVEKIRDNKYIPELSHCFECNFAINNKCVKPGINYGEKN